MNRGFKIIKSLWNEKKIFHEQPDGMNKEI